MKLESFIENFKDQLEDTSVPISAETNFKDLDNWDSLTTMLVIGMVKTDYDTDITATEIGECNTVLDLFNHIINS
ncbi:hypothetical protein GCM10022393_20530 [Aquimarina addita]|uniref:Carrier domain-containing protein n=1 Tax=Aquimarina addita TaxID=870485 RepID=A0ABP6UL11_9FLAO